MDVYVDLLLYAAKVIASLVALSAVGVTARKLFHWYVDKYKRENRTFLEFQLNYVQEHSMFPFFLIDNHLRIVRTNIALRRLFSAGSESFEGKNWFRLIEPNELGHVITIWNESIEQKSSYTNVVGVVLPDGTKLKMMITAEPFIYAGKTRAFIGTAAIVRPRGGS